MEPEEDTAGYSRTTQLHTPHIQLQKFCKTFIGDRQISERLWPLRSPDLSLVDSFLWGQGEDLCQKANDNWNPYSRYQSVKTCSTHSSHLCIVFVRHRCIVVVFHRCIVVLCTIVSLLFVITKLIVSQLK